MVWLVCCTMVLLSMTMASGTQLVKFCKVTQVISGTPATTSQMAKDVVTFLNWAAEPEHDERKKMGLQAVIILSTLTALSLYMKRFRWTVIKNRKLSESREAIFC